LIFARFPIGVVDLGWRLLDRMLLGRSGLLMLRLDRFLGLGEGRGREGGDKG
jgi:hypothetical protein